MDINANEMTTTRILRRTVRKLEMLKAYLGTSREEAIDTAVDQALQEAGLRLAEHDPKATAVSAVE